MMLGFEPQISHMLGKHSILELHPQTYHCVLTGAVHMVSLLGWLCSLQKLSLLEVPTSCHLQLPGVTTGSLPSLLYLHMLPTQRLPAGTLTLLHITWPSMISLVTLAYWMLAKSASYG
jgi:hypothetical protein